MWSPGSGPVVFMGDVGVRAPVPPRVFRAYEMVDARLFRTSDDPLELGGPPAAVPSCTARRRAERGWTELSRLREGLRRRSRRPFRFHGNACRSSRGGGTVRRLAGRANRRSRVAQPMRGCSRPCADEEFSERRSWPSEDRRRPSCTNLTAQVIGSRCTGHVPRCPGRGSPR